MRLQRSPSLWMVLSLTVLVSFAFPLTAQQSVNPCVAALPRNSLGAVYDTVEHYSASDLKLMFDEYAYEKNWSTHEEAIQAGLKVDVPVYGEVLTPHGNFNKATKDQWMHEFEQKRHLDFTHQQQSTVIIKSLNPSVIRALGSSCFEIGAWHDVELQGACQFTFRAGYRSDDRTGSGTRVTPISLVV